MTDKPYVTLHLVISSNWHGPSAFKLLPSGELWETVDFVLDHETDELVPEWSDGQLCDLELSPLYRHIHAALHLLQKA